MAYLNRHITNRLKEAFKASPIVFLNGARQAGKSTLAKSIAGEIGEKGYEAEYLTFDRPTLMAAASSALEDVVVYVAGNMKTDIKGVFSGSVPYLKMAGIVLGGWQMARAALAAHHHLHSGSGDADFYQAKIGTARFFADHFLSQAGGLRQAIVHGSAGVMALTEDQF